MAGVVDQDPVAPKAVNEIAGVSRHQRPVVGTRIAPRLQGLQVDVEQPALLAGATRVDEAVEALAGGPALATSLLRVGVASNLP